MNPFSLPGWLFALSIGAGVMGLHADDAVVVRGAITRSLDFLAREGDQWMNEKDCSACHHLPVLIWSHREAARRGFAVDGKKFAEFVEWADERARKAKSADETLALLRLARPEQVAFRHEKFRHVGPQLDGVVELRDGLGELLLRHERARLLGKSRAVSRSSSSACLDRSSAAFARCASPSARLACQRLRAMPMTSDAAMAAPAANASL